jgi:hypothetical protein
MSPLRWTVKSTKSLAAALTRQGHRVSADTVAGLLREKGLSPQAGTKALEGRQHPDRDAQFRYINEQARGYMGAGQPVISVDTGEKELVGDDKNAGRQWRPPADQPRRHREQHRGDHHPRRADRPRRTRPGHLRHRHQGHRQRHRRSAPGVCATRS